MLKSKSVDAKLALSESKESRFFLKNIINHVVDPIFVKDRQHRWIEGNSALWALFGKSEEELLYKSDYDFFPKAEADVFWQKDEEVFTTGKPNINVENFTDASGVTHIISTKKACFTDLNGEPILVGIIRDITDVTSLQEKLKESDEMRLKSIMDHSGRPAYIKDLEGKYVQVNKDRLKLLGAKEKDVIGKTSYDFFPKEYADIYTHNDRMVIEQGKAIEFEEIVPVNGKLRTYRAVKFPLYDINNRIYAIYSSATDITKDKEMEAELKEADRRKDEFLATLAHELRNPLAPLSNALHIVRLSGADENKRTEALNIMSRQLEQMVRLVDDLLDVSRISHGKLELHRKKITFSDIIDHALETAKPIIVANGHELSVRLPQETLWLDADLTRLSQIFSNLLNNAAKYTPPGGKIQLDAKVENNRVIVRIIDTGIGIPKDVLPRVFDMFTQGDTSIEKSHGGLGIGLTLVKTLVEMHGGTVEAHSQGEGQGSEFIVMLPVLSVTASLESPSVNKQEVHMDNAAKKMRILAVDDSPMSAKTLGYILEIMGYEVELAYDGMTAVAKAKSFVPDIVFLDIGMPGMSGYEVAKQIRSEPALKHCVLIAQTGWGQKEHRERSKEAGFNYHLVKPVNPETLKELLATVQRGDAAHPMEIHPA